MQEPLNLPPDKNVQSKKRRSKRLLALKMYNRKIEVAPASFANCKPCLHASASATITDATESKNHAPAAWKCPASSLIIVPMLHVAELLLNAASTLTFMMPKEGGLHLICCLLLFSIVR
jgi:hypothetical protein